MRIVALVFVAGCVENGSRSVGDFCNADADCASPGLSGLVCNDGWCRWEDGVQRLGDPCWSDADCGGATICEAPGFRDAPGLCCEVVLYPDYQLRPGDQEDVCAPGDEDTATAE